MVGIHRCMRHARCAWRSLSKATVSDELRPGETAYYAWKEYAAPKKVNRPLHVMLRS